jgi:signal transduction histidine kinase
MLAIRRLESAATVGAMGMFIIYIGSAALDPLNLAFLVTWAIIQPAIFSFINPPRMVQNILFILTVISDLHMISRVLNLMDAEKIHEKSPMTGHFLRSSMLISICFMMYNFLIGVAVESRHQSYMQVLRNQIAVSQSLKVKAEKALANRNLVFSSISHQLRNPLNCLLGSVEVVLKTAADPGVTELLGNAKVCGDLLLNMINNILDNAKADFNALTLEITSHNIVTVIDKVWRAMSQMVKQQKLNGEIYIENQIPEYLAFDEPRLVQILINLLSNSLKNTHAGYIRLVLSAQTVTDEQDWPRGSMHGSYCHSDLRDFDPQEVR